MIKRSFPLKNFVLTLICLSLIVQPCWADSLSSSDTLKVSDRWFAKDKVEHLGVSAFLSGVSYSIFRDFYNNDEKSSIYFSAAFTFGAGLGKEFYDLRTPQGTFSFKDLAADILGIGLGLWIATR